MFGDEALAARHCLRKIIYFNNRVCTWIASRAYFFAHNTFLDSGAKLSLSASSSNFASNGYISVLIHFLFSFKPLATHLLTNSKLFKSTTVYHTSFKNIPSLLRNCILVLPIWRYSVGFSKLIHWGFTELTTKHLIPFKVRNTPHGLKRPRKDFDEQLERKNYFLITYGHRPTIQPEDKSLTIPPDQTLH